MADFKAWALRHPVWFGVLFAAAWFVVSAAFPLAGGHQPNWLVDAGFSAIVGAAAGFAVSKGIFPTSE